MGSAKIDENFGWGKTQTSLRGRPKKGQNSMWSKTGHLLNHLKKKAKRLKHQFWLINWPKSVWPKSAAKVGQLTWPGNSHLAWGPTPTFCRVVASSVNGNTSGPKLSFFFEMKLLKETLLKRPPDTRHEPRCQRSRRKSRGHQVSANKSAKSGVRPSVPVHASSRDSDAAKALPQETANILIHLRCHAKALKGAGWEVHHAWN